MKMNAVGTILIILISVAFQRPAVIAVQEKDRSIISEDFLKNRPPKPKSGRRSRKPLSTYKPVTAPSGGTEESALQVGVTIWRLEPAESAVSKVEGASPADSANALEWIFKRVEADAQFRQGDSIRLSIESPRTGYLYVINRDWLADGSYGETNLIFPTRGEDNRLAAGKLIDIPGRGRAPFRADPKPNQTSELLIILVTSAPLQLPLAPNTIPISKTQLRLWEEKWGGDTYRFEMDGGAGQARTQEEDLAASGARIRQLTREDPLPQSIFSLTPKNNDGLLFNLVLSYVR
jgi:hypothetical protein